MCSCYFSPVPNALSNLLIIHAFNPQLSSLLEKVVVTTEVHKNLIALGLRLGMSSL